MSDLRVSLDELLPSKEAARSLPRVIDRLITGELQHVVITRRNKPRAVLITLEAYEALRAAVSSSPGPTR